MRRPALVGLLCISALAVVAMSGCGGAGVGDSANRGTLTAPGTGFPGLVGTLAVNPYPDTSQLYRYRDVLHNRYIRGNDDGSYDGWYGPPPDLTGDPPPPVGTVAYELIEGATLRIDLTARNLKPSFAYQTKFEGRPANPYPGYSDNRYDASNEALGRAGRWWCTGPDHDPMNITDRDLRFHTGHGVLGYLLFDFFLTDADGKADATCSVDSSYHVLWRTDQRSPTRNDGPTKAVDIAYDDDVYRDVPDFLDAPAEVYAEWEKGRARPGTLELPPGVYYCCLMLTEETFHNLWYGDTNDLDGGLWAHAMSDELFQFTIGGSDPGSGTGTIAGKVTVGGKKAVYAAQVSVSVDGTLHEAVTNRQGLYEITGVLEAEEAYTVNASHSTYGTDSASVIVVADETTTQNFDLTN